MILFKNYYLKLKILYKKIFSKKNFFSFSGVDIIIENIFRNKKDGFYIDVGCQHPIKNNNTYLLHSKGWEGINIDLDIDNINLFNAARPLDDNIHSAVSNKVGTEDLYFYHKKSPINTLNKNVSKFQKAEVKDIRKITTTTLNSIIANSKFKDKKFNLLSIDVEGHEKSVIEGAINTIINNNYPPILFESWEPGARSIYDDNFLKNNRKDLFETIESLGYKIKKLLPNWDEQLIAIKE